MRENRKEQIMGMLQEGNILAKDCYPSKELLPHLKIFMHSLLKTIYEETHAEMMDSKSMLKHLEELAEKYGFKDMPELLEFRKEIEALRKRIRGLEKGQLGEKFGRQALSRVHEKKIILSNLTLEIEGECAEFDFIAITRKGVFVVEAKHNSCDMEITENGNYVMANGTRHSKIYNIGQSMNSKKYILAQKIRSILEPTGTKLAVPIQNIILYTNNYSKLTDNYHYEQICYCSSLPHYIDNYEGNGKELSDTEMKELATALKAEAVVMEYPTEINADKIRNELAEILVVLEEAAMKESFIEDFGKLLTEDFEAELSKADAAENVEHNTGEERTVNINPAKKQKTRHIFRNIVKASAGLAIVGAVAALRKRH